MSALDRAKLSRHIITTCPDLSYFSELEFVWHNIHQQRDLVLGSPPGADYWKTGHTDAAG
jgi:D-alanyl-D-alanine carboxypeptidase